MEELHEEVSLDPPSQVDKEEETGSLHQRTGHSERIHGEHELRGAQLAADILLCVLVGCVCELSYRCFVVGCSNIVSLETQPPYFKYT